MYMSGKPVTTIIYLFTAVVNAVSL